MAANLHINVMKSLYCAVSGAYKGKERATNRMNRCSKPSAVYSTIDYSNLHETASAAYRCASC